MLRTIANPIIFKAGSSFSILPASESLAFASIVSSRIARIAGPLGSIDLELPDSLTCSFEDNTLKIDLLKSKNELSKDEKAKIGTFKSLVLSSITGTTQYHSRVVVFTGTGIDVKVVDQKLKLEIGKSHPILLDIPTSLSCAVESSDIKQIRLRVKGVDSAQVGKFVRELSDLVRNPYKNGKHIYPEDRELITREGKKK